ncbi:MAG: polyphosphate kinase 2, partial [bacterium]
MGHKKEKEKVSEKKKSKKAEQAAEPETEKLEKLPKKFYEEELEKLQIELVKLQEWIKYKGLRVVVLFEGRDAAGKGGAIK